MTKIILAVAVLGLCVFGLCFNIIFRKNGKFPDGEVGHNKELRKRGIVCAREEDEKIWGRSSHIKVTGRGKIKAEPDQACLTCADVSCSFKQVMEKNK